MEVRRRVGKTQTARFEADVLRHSPAWSGPSGILLHTLGFGLSAGADVRPPLSLSRRARADPTDAQVYDVVLILRTSKAVNSFTHPRISLGGEMTISAGPCLHSGDPIVRGS